MTILFRESAIFSVVEIKVSQQKGKEMRYGNRILFSGGSYRGNSFGVIAGLSQKLISLSYRDY